MRITLNLATRPYTDIGPALKRLRIAMAVLALMAIGLWLGLRAVHQKADEARATEQRVQSKIDAINREREGYHQMMRQPANARLLTEVGMLNQLFEQKTFSWTLAMEDLENVVPGGVQVATLEPTSDEKTGRTTLKLRVVGPRDRADDLVQNLEHSKHFLLPGIVGESSEATATGGQADRLEPLNASNRFTFELQAVYNPAVTTERKAQKKPEGKKPSAGEDGASQQLKSNTGGVR
ncbi:MAG: fimbrial assembly protein [Terracidiphilus sp.]|jgi:type IV pilus assembly protein PilN